MPNKTRAFVVTNWNLDTDYQAIIDKGQIRFIAYGRETCPTTGKPHDQAFCYFYNPRGTTKRVLKTIGDMFGPIHCYVAPMRGSFAENEAYCSKEQSYTKVGDQPNQGERGDIKEIADAIMSGEKTSDEICVANPAFHHQYGRTLDRLEAIALRKKFRTEMTKGIWYYGPSEVGKSHQVFTQSYGEYGPFDPETHYVKNVNEEWWDGYVGQPIVIINEFRGQIRFSELLDLVDKWPKNVKIRNRASVPFLAKYVIITSFMSPKDVYKNISKDEGWTQLERRFEIHHLTKKRAVEDFLAPSSAPSAESRPDAPTCADDRDPTCSF